MGLQHGAITLQIDALAIIRVKHPIAASLLEAATQGSLLVTGAGCGGVLIALVSG
jgi:mevalonate kinase